MSEILKRIIDTLDADEEVRGIGVCRRAAYVLSGHMGVAYGFWNRSRACDDIVRLPSNAFDHYIGRGVLELAKLALSDDAFEASVGVAAINSLIEPSLSCTIERNGYQIAMERAKGKKLAVVGHFSFVEDIGDSVEKLWVLELDPQEDDLPADMASEVIPQADVVVITGTTFVNHTIDGLLDLARGKDIIMLGPTTIMSPVLFDCGISALCGVRIGDEKMTIDHLKAGRGMRDLAGIRRICLLPKKA